ncbi:MAG: hypothetical protein EBU46_15280, partial [Nitrosomonadaceae bacterium]|nr:hypothetical protein [Nitrosomonadaceae bacterium]
MKKYHYLDDRGDISDALPLAALQKIGLPPTTKVLIEGGQQWITLAEAMAGGSVVVPLPPPPVAASENPAKPPPPLSGLKKVFKGCLILVIGFPIFIGILMYLADRGVGGAKVSNAGAEATRDNASKTRDGGG